MRKLSKAEATAIGALGLQKSRITVQAQKEKRIESYLQNPKKCIHCSNIIPYEERIKKFCNHTCSASYNNIHRTKKAQWSCSGCGKVHDSIPHKIRKYCDHACSKIHQKRSTFERLKNGLITSRGVMRNVLIREFGHKCFKCNLTEWHGHPIPLEIDHIDGNAGNNSYNNIQLICANCHGITPTWKGRNKGNGRATRGLPLN